MIIKNEITVGDFISIAGFITATFGLFLAYYQMVKSNKHKRADFVMDACRQFAASVDLQEIYYELEYDKFVYSEAFHESPKERTLDKLLILFENVSKLFEMGNISRYDLDIISYHFLVTYENEEIGKYFSFLDSSCEKRGLPKRYSSFRNVCEILKRKKAGFTGRVFSSPKNCGSFFEKIALGGARGGGRAPPKQFFEVLTARRGIAPSL